MKQKGLLLVMEPRSFSATALNVANLCLARYKAEHIDYSKSFVGNAAANLGTTVHGALELYVKAVYLDKTDAASLDLLLMYFKMQYMTMFKTDDLATAEYLDGLDMLTRWFKRTDFSKFTVISCEVKQNFLLTTSIGNIPFNYIWDRHDQLGENEYRVVDYKSNRWGINPTDLRDKIQARAYGVAAQIKYPNATKIWVQFDMLRHEGPVGISYSREDNIQTWKWMKEKAEEIIATPYDRAPETLNQECLFCVRKATCKALLTNISVGGIHSLDNPQIVDKRAQLEFQKKAVESALKEIDTVIIERVKAEDTQQIESDYNTANISVSQRRDVDAERVEQVIGPALFDRYGGKSFTMAAVDKLLKGGELTEDQKGMLRQLIYFKQGNPSIKISPKSVWD